MSFLECAGDAAVLAEALAFIDGFDVADETSSSSSSEAAAVGDDLKRRRVELRTPPDTFERARNRRKSALYSARLRAKKKSERTELEEQVVRLELQLQRLQRGGRSSGSSSPATSSSSDGELNCSGLVRRARGAASTRWLEAAADQALKRKKAEQLNAQMKTYLAKLRKTAATMQESFQTLQALRSEIGEVVGPPSTVLAGPSLRTNDATPQLSELREYMDQMYSDAPAVFPLADSRDAASFQLQIKRNPTSGTVVGRISSLTSVGCDLDAASRMVWNGMQLKGSMCCKEFVHRHHMNANTVAKSYFMSVDDQHNSCMLHGVSFVRKFEERDRILYMWTSAIVPPQHDQISKFPDSKRKLIRFREKGWAMLSRAPENPECASVFRTSYEIFGERHDAGDSTQNDLLNYTASKRDYERLCSEVVEMLTSSLRLFHEGVQNKLLENFPRG